MRWPFTKTKAVNQFDYLPLDRIMEYLVKLKVGQNGYIDVIKQKNPKTLPQLAYYHGVIIPAMVDAFVDNGDFSLAIEIKGNRVEIELTRDNLDQFLKTRYAAFSGSYMDKVEMSDAQMSSYISWVIKWSREWLNCNIPEPEKDRK